MPDPYPAFSLPLRPPLHRPLQRPLHRPLHGPLHGPLRCLLACLPTLLPAFAQALSAQTVALPVHDLVETDRLSDGLDPEMGRRLAWIHRGRQPWEEGDTGVMGEGTLLNGRPCKPWLDHETVIAVVQALADLSRSDPEIHDGQLIVHRTDAEAARNGLQRLRAELPPRLDLQVLLQRIPAKGDPVTLLRTRQWVRAGVTATFDDIAKRRVLQDYEVEIAHSASIANPVVGDLATGACLAVRPRLLPGKDEVLIEAFARAAEDAPAPDIDTASDGIGPIDRAARTLCECGVALRIPRGAQRAVEWTGTGGDRMRLTCSASWVGAPTPPRTGALVRLRSLYHRGVARFRTDLPEPDEAPRAFPVEAAFRRAGSDSVQVLGDNDCALGAVIVPGKNADQIDADVATRLVRSLASTDLEITCLDLPEGVDPTAAGDRGTVLARITSPVLIGHSAAFSGRTEMRYVADWDVEVAQSARVPDPKVRFLRHGYHADARVDSGPDGGLERVALEACFTTLERIEPRKTVLCGSLRAGGTPDQNGTIMPPIVLPKQEVIIESPMLREQTVSAVLLLDRDGKAVLRRAAPKLLGRGRELVVVVKVQQ